MPTLRFEGYSDDTFGEYAHTSDDYDNCASGKPIEFLVLSADGSEGVVVTGQHCPGNSGPDHEDRPFPAWPMRMQPGEGKWNFNPALVIEAPEGVKVTCLTRKQGDDE